MAYVVFQHRETEFNTYFFYSEKKNLPNALILDDSGEAHSTKT